MSIRDEQELSFAASALKDKGSDLIKCDASPSGALVPAAVLYGANASGKTTVLSALRFMRSAILQSHRRGEPDSDIPRRFFALAKGYDKKPTTFDIDFVVSGVHYYYGFHANNERFEREWLHAYPRKRKQILFERKGQSFKFGGYLKGQNSVISQITRPNSLFLSAAFQTQHPQLSKLSDFFSSIAITTVDDARLNRFFLAGEKLDHRILKFLDSVGTGIFCSRATEIELGGKQGEFMKEFSLLMRKIFGDDVPPQEAFEKHIEIQLGHRAKGDEPIYLDFEVESAGTRRLMTLLIPIFEALDRGSVVAIDELDASLHTLACEAVLELFCSKKFNPRGAQLLATTHDTNLLGSRRLRRDQIWFTEKDGSGGTALTPLTDIKTRREDNLERGYLQGRFGAIPFSGAAGILGRGILE